MSDCNRILLNCESLLEQFGLNGLSISQTVNSTFILYAINCTVLRLHNSSAVKHILKEEEMHETSEMQHTELNSLTGLYRI